MGTAGAVFLGGFADPVDESQRVFRAVLNSFSHPGRSYDLSVVITPPAPLTSGLGAIALMILDADTSVWLDESLAANGTVAQWLRFHTGTTIVTDHVDADFALISTASVGLSGFAGGSAENPHLSATVVIEATGAELVDVVLAGPGIQTVERVGVPFAWPDFDDQWRDNAALFPRGVDIIFVDSHAEVPRVSALPRTTVLTRAREGN